MHNQTHPDTGQLDRLHAGLLDDSPGEKLALEKHLANCQRCRDTLDNWHQLMPVALGPDASSSGLSNDLLKRRRLALQTMAAHHFGAFPSLATAAILVCAVSVGFWLLQPDNTESPVVAVQNTDSVPDIYEDLDFYLWLANRKDSKDNRNTESPNST